MFNSFPDTRGTLVTTTEKRQKEREGETRKGRMRKEIRRNEMFVLYLLLADV